ncbi:hypothetical protein LCGC14_1435980 [marine sediment metagenome]|uniref:Uncharacterized protein n=1 Tax=marine sediment metagenome TaxID=412755 RepID=A0A0F9K8C9_9ZZZZ
MPYYAPGRYGARIISHSVSKAGTGTPQVVIRFAPYVMARTDRKPQDADYWGPLAGEPQEATLYLYLTSNTVERTIADLETLGMSGATQISHFDEASPSAPPTCRIVGKEVILDCAHESYKGDMKERWRVAGSGSIATLPQEELAAIDRDFSGYLTKRTPATPSTLPPGGNTPARPEVTLGPPLQDLLQGPRDATPPPPSPPASNEDDLPF